jgi:UDP-2,3-diacylglucosamine pyrophosphatase LpxH
MKTEQCALHTDAPKSGAPVSFDALDGTKSAWEETMPSAPSKTPNRLIVVSDLHLGGETPTMCSKPDVLTAFIEQLPSTLLDDEKLELVIAGDFIDFLAITPHRAWTADPAEAVQKLRSTMHDSKFKEVFESLAGLVSTGHYLTILVGNHDVEMVMPQVQDEFLRGIQAVSHQVSFIDDGRAYRVGKALIEHGNRYDGANVNDWDGLRSIASALSRNEKLPVDLEISAGSQIVERVVNAVHDRYPFINLLQPEGELTALLLVAFEPALRWHIGKLAVLLKGGCRRFDNPDGRQPPKSNNVAYSRLEQRDDELANVFGDDYEELRNPPNSVTWWEAVRDWSSILLTPQADSLSAIIDRGDAIPKDRLEKIRVAMSRILLDDHSQQPDGPTAQYRMAAERIINSSQGTVQTVVMGHTHQARHIGNPQRASYINTGTWADIIRVPREVLENTGNQELEPYLRKLKDGQGRILVPTFADLRVEANGDVKSACLRVFEGRRDE